MRKLVEELVGVAKELTARQWAGKIDIKRKLRDLQQRLEDDNLFIKDAAHELNSVIAKGVRRLHARDFIKLGIVEDEREFREEVLDPLSDITDRLMHDVGDVEEFDDVLNELYDWADMNSIWLGL